MQIFTKALPFVIVVGLGAAAAAQQQASKTESRDTPPKGNAENGRKIYAAYGCYQCHNYAANGGAAGPRLAPRPIPYGEFSTYVRKPTGDMPPYTTKVVADAELADIYAFLLTIPDPPK